jgi:hypothetical protein
VEPGRSWSQTERQAGVAAKVNAMSLSSRRSLLAPNEAW